MVYGVTMHILCVSGAVQSGKIAFHARCSADQCVSVGQVLAHDEVHVNVGNGYTTHDGIFITP